MCIHNFYIQIGILCINMVIAGPSEKYWEVIAERRRKALEEVLDENRKLHSLVVTLEAENMACKELLEKTTDLVNTLKVIYVFFHLTFQSSCNI